jgi:tetratricopeptide (TPR) repeat protein
MMNSINARRQLFILFFSIHYLISGGQSLFQVLDVANQQYRLGNYSLALKEYQRFLFFDHGDDPEVFDHIGSCFENLKQFDQAAQFYDKAFFSYSDHHLKYKALFSKIENMIYMKDYALALADILSMSDSIVGNDYYKKEFLTGICYFGMEDFSNAKNSFINCIETTDTATRKKTEQIFCNRKNFYSPNPKTASVLSMCFPGIGQFYAGDIRNGVNSVLLTSALALLGVRIGIHQTFYDAFFTVMPWFQRYYQGGYIRAESIAIQKRAIHRSKAYQQTIDLIANSKK